MQTINFPEANKTFGRPMELNEVQCGSVRILQFGNTCISCWELDDADIADLVKTRKLYLGVLSGATQPPVIISTQLEIVKQADC